MPLWITRSVRRRLSLDEEGAGGKITLSSFAAAHALAGLIRQSAALPKADETDAVDASALVALDVLGELVERRLERVLADRRDLLERGARSLAERLGERRASEVLRRFLDELELAPAKTAAPSADDAADATGCVRELLVLTVLTRHPRARKVLGHLGLSVETDPDLADTVTTLGEVLEREPAPWRGERDLLAELAAPLEVGGEDFAAALESVLASWDEGVEEEARRRVDAALGLLAEAATPRFAPGHAPDPGIGLDEGPANYTRDASWMPDLVLVAKNVLVWLDQLSRRYGRSIRRLDELPGEELASLARRGVTGLWLIGVWERSPASARIKRSQGNPDAASSAYAVRRYRIAPELGGDEALDRLAARAADHGIRLAADVVPNHLSIDSDWVLEHPERFLSVAEPPFPNYRFSGEDLSPHPDVGIYLEDHYADRSDAAVVFERLDRRTGERRYIYHGNDGTSTPWNDTAQLDYLNPETRQAVTESILRAAGRFSILRFDAAMTLTRQHIHRLWYPAPGAAGAIPSRAEHGLSSDEMERRMPAEFWRQVVDQVQGEAPDTLLVAEAFWLMEGYFVRRLGMHRVYNSAFMHMLRDGRTATLRRLFAETVEIDVELLGRFVNYLSNPDEETAVEQFGRGDRYFGACKVLATLPGLPMLAHGQWEGLAEKYGMEYRRAYRDEGPDEEMVSRHDREIAPLLRRRELFSGVEEFLLLTLEHGGRPIDSVLAFANGSGERLVVVAFNNSDAAVEGRLVSQPSGGLAERVRPAAGPRGAATTRAARGGQGTREREDPWEMEDLATGRRVAWSLSGDSGEVLELRLEAYECIVLGSPPLGGSRVDGRSEAPESVRGGGVAGDGAAG